MAKLVQAGILNTSGRCQKEAETWDQSLEINLSPFWGIFGLPAFVSNDQLTCFRKAPSSQKKNGFFSCLTKSEWRVLPNWKYFKRIYQKVVGEHSRPPEQVMKVWTFEKSTWATSLQSHILCVEERLRCICRIADLTIETKTHLGLLPNN